LKAALKCLVDNPVIAIFRGGTPDEVLAVVAVLVDAGFKVIQVSLNAPFAVSSAAKLANRFGQHVRVGAGTAL
jgi:2-dehydro-3-deoxyphosphogalactonate aldolase